MARSSTDGTEAPARRSGAPSGDSARSGCPAIAYSALLKRTFQAFVGDKVPRLGAALAYYAVFSLAPLLVVLISIVGLVYGREAASGQIQGQIEGIVGPDAAKLIQTMVANTGRSAATGILSLAAGLVTLLLGAAGVFGQLKDALNTIWGVAPPEGQGVRGFVRSQALSFGAVVVCGLLLLAFLTLTTLLSALAGSLGALGPGLGVALHVANLLISFGVVTVLFALLYKLLPDAVVAWRDVWLGAAVTALLFAVGKLLIGLYLGLTAPGSAYGAAGSLVVLLLWIYYSAQLLLFGAVFTRTYAESYGSRAAPARSAAGEESTTAASPAVREPTPAGRPGARTGGRPLALLLGVLLGSGRRWR